MERLPVGMVGVGNFGAARRRTMRASERFQILAAYDLRADKLAECQAEDGAQPVGSFEELLDFPGIRALFVSTGGKYHAEQVIAAARRGLHVFVEKPLCSTPEEVEAILAAQREHGVVIGCGHNDHSRSGISREIQHRMASGDLGTVAAFEATTAHTGGLLIKPGEWRGDPQKNPGGMLFQCGVHKIHELMYYFGPVSEVMAMMRYDVNANTGTADTAQCLLRFAGGITGTLCAYHVAPYRHTLSIFGTTANLYRRDLFFDEGTVLERQESKRDGSKEPAIPLQVTEGDDPTGGLVSFYDAIHGGTRLYPSVIDGARAVDVVFACEESARTGRSVTVPTR